MRTTFALTLIAVACGFAWIAAAPWLNEAPRVAPGASDATAEAPPVFQPRPEVQTDFAAWTERPLFSAHRRPPPPEAPGLPIVDPMADRLFGRYEIAGVVALGRQIVAMLRDPDGKLIRIRAGDQIKTRNGVADVVEITLDSLTFSEGGHTVVSPVDGEGAKTE